jgi:Baseplate J-like protein
MKLVAPKIDRRNFRDLLEESRTLALLYTPEWITGQQDEPGQALLNIYLHLQEQILSRLNRTPEKNFLAFLDMMGIKQLPAQSAQAAVTFTLANGTTAHVLVPNGTLLSGQAADGSGEAIFQTQKDRLVTPATLQAIFSYDASQDSIYEHTQDANEPRPFTVFDGIDRQEHILYLAHADLFNQKKPTEIEVDLLLAEVASEASDLSVMWEYFDGTRWVAIARFDREPENGEFDEDDGTGLFTKSGVMVLRKGHTAEIAETEIAGFNSRWIRCRLIRSLPVSASVQLPVINTIHISVNPLEPFAPDLAFHNDISLELEEISAKMLAKGAVLSLSQNSPDPDDRRTIFIANASETLSVGDFLKLDNGLDSVEIREIDAIDGNSIALNQALLSDYKLADPPATVVLHTALRPGETSVEVESLAGIEISGDSKVTLFHRGQKETASLTTISFGEQETTLTLLREADQNSVPFYINGDIVKITPTIKPFGELPQTFDTFYIASDEAFSKKGAKITLDIDAKWNNFPPDDSQDNPLPNPVLSWEYWNGKSWRGIRVSDTTGKFIQCGKVIFTSPDDLEKVEVNGEEKFWIRARIIDGDYGKEILIVPGDSGLEVEIRAGTVHFPIISRLEIDYENVPQFLQQCVTLNNLNFEDHTEDSLDETRTFAPFTTFPERFASLFLGFNNALIGGPLSILFNLNEQPLGEDERLKILWFYWNGSAWVQLNVLDETENLTRIGLLEFVIGRDFARRRLFGQEQFWLKGSLVEGEHPEPLMINSLHLNTTYALQADVASNEIAGSSNGTAGQEFTLQHPLVISQQVFIREPVLPTEDEQRAIRKKEGPDAIVERKNELGETIEILVRWHAVDDFDDSGPQSRDYTIDQRLGKIGFGDGNRGMIPPVGADNIIVSYTFGGGTRGNVPVNAISGLKSAVPFVNTVTNHLAADGGSETESLDDVLTRGPLLLKTRDRAVTPEDFEALAKSASRKVARAKCLPNTDEERNMAPGWVTVMIVPESDEAKPQPNQLLIKVVREGLEEHGANVVSWPGHIHVTGPDYTEVLVEASVVPTSLERAAVVETAVRERLNRYIHPLTGGPKETGWEFGREICLSDILALIEGIEDVDHVEEMVLRADGKPYRGNVQLGRYSLPVSGEHQISITLGSAQNGFDPCRRSETECAKRRDLKRVECETLRI